MTKTNISYVILNLFQDLLQRNDMLKWMQHDITYHNTSAKYLAV